MYQVSVQIETKKKCYNYENKYKKSNIYILVGSKRQVQKNITIMREDKKNIVMQNLV